MTADAVPSAPAAPRVLGSRRLLADAALVLLVLATYGGSLEGDFVFDDRLSY